MHSAHTILAQLGGYREVATRLGLPATTVHSWRRRGSIPSRHWPALIRMAAERDVVLCAVSFIGNHPTHNAYEGKTVPATNLQSATAGTAAAGIDP
jgi:hypothetical protein